MSLYVVMLFVLYVFSSVTENKSKSALGHAPKRNRLSCRVYCRRQSIL